MDHKISKDMISSGLTPSGEKTQADLGRTQYGSAPSPSSLMEAYRSIYEHHQKDADGKVIEHEEKEELNEGKMPEGLKNYLMKKKGKKEDKKEEMKKESVDLFDLVKGKLIDEGCEEKEALKIMANMTKEEFDEVSEGIGAAIMGIAFALMFIPEKKAVALGFTLDGYARAMQAVSALTPESVEAANAVVEAAGRYVEIQSEMRMPDADAFVQAMAGVFGADSDSGGGQDIVLKVNGREFARAVDVAINKQHNLRMD